MQSSIDSYVNEIKVLFFMCAVYFDHQTGAPHKEEL